MFGNADPFNSENKEGSIKVTGLNFENSINSASNSSVFLLEKLCKVATIPF